MDQHPDNELVPGMTEEDEELGQSIGRNVAWAPGPPRKMRMLETIFSNPDAGTPFDDRFFTQLNNGGIMDLPQGTQERVQRLGLLTYRKNAMGFAATEVKNDFVIGSGVKLIAADPTVQAVLDQHWLENEWDDKLPERTRALSIFGEQLYPAFVREEDGLVRLTTITPLKISEILRHNENAEEIVAVAVAHGDQTNADQFTLGLAPQTDVRIWQVIQRMTDLGGMIGPADTGPAAQQAFFFTINRVSGASRGTPDLCSAMDWLEGIDGMIFSMMERAEMTQDVVFDLEYQGATAQELRGYARNFASALRSGGIFAHNEKTKLSIQSPELAASDAGEMVQILRSQVYAGSRLAGLFLGSAADLTRSSASEISVTTAKHFESRQGEINRMLRKILDFQIQEAKKRGRLEGVTDFRYQIEFPRIFLKDMSTIASALQLTSIALQLASQNEWISKDEAANAFRKIMQALGTDVSDQEIVPDRAVDPDAQFLDPDAGDGTEPGGDAGAGDETSIVPPGGDPPAEV